MSRGTVPSWWTDPHPASVNGGIHAANWRHGRRDGQRRKSGQLLILPWRNRLTPLESPEYNQPRLPSQGAIPGTVSVIFPVTIPDSIPVTVPQSCYPEALPLGAGRLPYPTQTALSPTRVNRLSSVCCGLRHDHQVYFRYRWSSQFYRQGDLRCFHRTHSQEPRAIRLCRKAGPLPEC